MTWHDMIRCGSSVFGLCAADNISVMALHGMVELALRKKWHYVAAGGSVDM